MTKARPNFDRLRDALARSLAEDFPEAALQDFPSDGEVGGVKVLLETDRGLSDVILWKSGAFDLEAVEKLSERVLMRKHSDQITAQELSTTIRALANAMR